jgi:hypothetical protein
MKPHAFAERTQSSRQIRPLRWGAAPRSPMRRSPVAAEQVFREWVTEKAAAHRPVRMG